MRVSEVMSRDPVTIGPSESCHEAATRMFRGKVRHLPVVDRAGTLAGIVTDRDLRHRLLAPAVSSEARPVTVESVLKSVPVSAWGVGASVRRAYPNRRGGAVILRTRNPGDRVWHLGCSIRAA